MLTVISSKGKRIGEIICKEVDNQYHFVDDSVVCYRFILGEIDCTKFNMLCQKVKENLLVLLRLPDLHSQICLYWCIFSGSGSSSL